MKKPLLLSLGLALCFAALAETVSATPPRAQKAAPKTDLYEVFKNPDTKYRPYVRWWWNGGRQTKAEIERELDLLHEAGIGGVEINTIAFPGGDTLGCRALPWLSDEWLEMAQTAVEGCRRRGMTADIIVGSGWPYGAEFLTRDQQLQMLTIETIDLKGGERFTIDRDEILRRVNPKIHSVYPNSLKELLYLRLMPKKVDAFTEGIYYDSLAGAQTISIDVPQGEHVLYCFVKLTGYMSVILGAPGAKGPVLNHFDRSAVEQFLNRMSDRMAPKMGTMGGTNLRAAFTDSFELEGANWDKNMLAEFKRRRGYSLEPYLPYLIFKVGGMGNPVNEKYGSDFSDSLQQNVIGRVRNDFDLTQRELFHEAFTLPYNKWCHRNGMKSRVQAYGRGLHPLESSMYIDIPECETWFAYQNGEKFPANTITGRGYTPVNKFVSSAAHLAGNPNVSCEEITNTGWVFNATLEKLKLTGDMSNLTGVNHSIFHGFNYSPKEAPFPGWIRYGTYFSERNTWWPYLRHWMDYKARLSALLVNSEQQADIAILHPLEDLWSKYGSQRDPFAKITYPVYANMVWESIHQNGGGCDYISEKILTGGRYAKGALHYGSRAYKTILLVEVESIRPAAAEALERFVAAGGKAICIGAEPHRSVGLQNAEANDRRVRETIARIKQRYPERFVRVAAPDDTTPALDWYRNLSREQQIGAYVQIGSPNERFSQNHYAHGAQDIFFFVNYDVNNGCTQQLRFDLPQGAHKSAWLWNPETGSRSRLTGWDGATLELNFGPAESKLIVFEEGDVDDPQAGTIGAPATCPRNGTPLQTLGGAWNLTLTHAVTGERSSLTLDSLVDFNTLPMPSLRHFAGTIDYTTTATVSDPRAVTLLDAGETFNGITELIVNGTPVGVKWYGDRVFDIGGKLHTGENTITLRITTLLGNYCKSLTDNETTQNWTKRQPYLPLGLGGPVRLY